MVRDINPSIHLYLVWAAEVLSARIIAAQVAVADLRVGLRIRQWVGEGVAREQQSDYGDESGELHGDLGAAIR